MIAKITGSFTIRTLSDQTPVPQPHFNVLWVIRGRAQCQVDKKQLYIHDNQLLCLSPGRYTRLDSTEQLEGYRISFNDIFFNADEKEFVPSAPGSLFNIFTQPMAIPLPDHTLTDMLAILEGMKKESENHLPYRDQLIKRYFRIFLLHLSRHSPAPSDERTVQNGSEQLTRSFISLLELHFKKYRFVSDYAARLTVTANHLNVAVKKYTGFTAGHFIRQRLMREAKRLIVYSDLCMKEIANDLGFSDTAHFSKFFKNGSGMNFSDFKKEKIYINPQKW